MKRQVKIDDPEVLFWAVRGNAIQAYANLEQILCAALGAFGDLSHEVASIIFFNVPAFNRVEAILEKLLKKKAGTRYDIFWDSFWKHARHCNNQRNLIVHWNAAEILSLPNTRTMQLQHPSFYSQGSDPITTEHLFAFVAKCEFLTNLCNMFIIHLDPHGLDRLPAAEQQTWRDIFQQEVTYPPLSTHPLFQTPPTPGSPPQPFQPSDPTVSGFQVP